MNCNLKLYWKDPRLQDYLRKWKQYERSARPPLPDKLWRPGAAAPTFKNKLFFVSDAKPDKDVQLDERVNEEHWFYVESPYHGEIVNHMDVALFPFDEQSLDMRFSGQVRRDGTPTQVVPVVPSDGTPPTSWISEFDFINEPDINEPEAPVVAKPKEPVVALFHDSMAVVMPEFRLIGAWHAIENRPNGSYFHIGIVLRRRWLYFFWHVIHVQWIVVFLTFCCMPMHPSEDFEPRLALVVTMYLVSTATLYVISDSLPKTAKHTFLSKLITVSSGFVFAIALETTLLACAAGRPFEKK